MDTMYVTRLVCTECDNGKMRKHPASASGPRAGYAVCDNAACAKMVSVPLDVLPYADDATLDVDESGYLVAITED